MKEKTGRKKIIAAGVAAAVFVLAACFCRPVFYLNDDVTMRSILSGSYAGVPDGHAVYMKYPLTFLLSLLYRLIKQIPWLELFFAGCLIWSVAEIAGTVNRGKMEHFMTMFLGILFVLPFFLYMHYTIIAAVLAGTAAFLLGTEECGWKTAVFWLLAWTVRSQVAYLALPFMGVAIVWRLVGKVHLGAKGVKEEGALLGKILGIGCAGLLVCVIWNQSAYAPEEWREYLRYNEARTDLYDYTDFLSTGKYAQEFDRYGMTKEEFLVLNSYDTLLSSEIDADKMEAVAGLVTSGMESQQDVVELIKSSLLQYYYQIRYADNEYVLLWMAVFALLGMLLLLRRCFAGLFLLGCLGVGRSLIWIFLIMQGRFPERVSLSLYVIELLLLTGMLQKMPERESGRKKLQTGYLAQWKDIGSKYAKGILQLFVGVSMVCILLIQTITVIPKVKAQKEVQAEWNALKSHCESDPNTLYLLDVFSVAKYSGLQYEGDPSNMMMAGGWMSASPLALKRMGQRGGATDAGQALYESENISFIANQEKNIEWLEEYLSNRFGTCVLEPVDRIYCGDETVFTEYKVIK